MPSNVTRSESHPQEPDPRQLSREELRAYLRSVHTVTLWPFTGRALSASRSLTYQLSHRGTIKVLVLGHRRRVASIWLEATLFGEPDGHDAR